MTTREKDAALIDQQRIEQNQSRFMIQISLKGVAIGSRVELPIRIQSDCDSSALSTWRVYSMHNSALSSYCFSPASGCARELVRHITR